jgi:ribonuclease D
MDHVFLHKGDLPNDLDLGFCVAIDTETMGLKPRRDKLCLIQLSSGDGTAHMVQFDRSTYNAPNLKKLLGNPKVEKLFHFARFDVAVISHYLGVVCNPIYCTRTASKLARTYTDKHGLRDVCRELLGIEISKHYQSSDWGTDTLSKEQMTYAAHDVLYLHKLREKFDVMLARENRTALARQCFDFIPVRGELDLLGFGSDLFDH